ncbi:hypothetical protein CO610_00830 [Lysobacteraceae bacterium NML95-0200]|nr:hypothetical protein CO610_00830 [Xanthomonadaceae bacterium NML95-0200]
MNDQQFDQQLRQQWQAAAAHLPGPVRLQLSPAIAAQRRQPARSRLLPWSAAFASLALLTVLLAPVWKSPEPVPPATLATQAPPQDTDLDSDDDLLSVTPDFYAWLDSEEIRTLAAK